jgi:hypothetical protein
VARAYLLVLPLYLVGLVTLAAIVVIALGGLRERC